MTGLRFDWPTIALSLYLEATLVVTPPVSRILISATDLLEHRSPRNCREYSSAATAEAAQQKKPLDPQAEVPGLAGRGDLPARQWLLPCPIAVSGPGRNPKTCTLFVKATQIPDVPSLAVNGFIR